MHTNIKTIEQKHDNHKQKQQTNLTKKKYRTQKEHKPCQQKCKNI